MKFDDYKEALKGAGPKLTGSILFRATEDSEISFADFVEFEESARSGGEPTKQECQQC